MPELNLNTYHTTMQVRPDDIDMFGHVHSSRYIDYVLAARYHQMEHFYKMPMEEFLRNKLGWVIKSTTINFKRPLTLGNEFVVKTRIGSMEKSDVLVHFAIENTAHKTCCDGHFLYTMISLTTHKAEIIPDWIMNRFCI